MRSTKAIIAALIVGVMMLTGCVINTEMAGEEQTVNVAGNAELTVEPDKAEVAVGVSVLKTSAQEAQSQANSITSAIIQGLRAQGIPEENIETERLNLYEERQWEEGKTKTTGWRATQTLNIETTDLDQVGTIVDTAVDNGANQINNIRFTLSEERESEYKKQALSQAAANAKEKAETIAQSLGLELGKIKTVSESSYNIAPYRYAMEAAAGADMVQEASSILPSDVSVTGHVSVVYYVE